MTKKIVLYCKFGLRNEHSSTSGRQKINEPVKCGDDCVELPPARIILPYTLECANIKRLILPQTP